MPLSLMSPKCPSSICIATTPSQWPRDGGAFDSHGQPQSQLQNSSHLPFQNHCVSVITCLPSLTRVQVHGSHWKKTLDLMNFPSIDAGRTADLGKCRLNSTIYSLILSSRKHLNMGELYFASMNDMH